MNSGTQFKSLMSGIYGEYQIVLEEGIHVAVYKVKIWNVREGYNEETSIILYDRDLLDLICRVVEKVHKLTKDIYKDMEILWLP